MDGPTEAQRAEATIPGIYSHQVLVMGFRPRPPGLFTRTEPRDRPSSLSEPLFHYMLGSYVQKLNTQAIYLCEKSRSIENDFSTIRKTKAHVQKYIANDTGSQSWGGNRDWWRLWQIEEHMSFLERIFLALTRCCYAGMEVQGCHIAYFKRSPTLFFP